MHTLSLHDALPISMPNMISAQKLYLKKGFEYIDKPMGNTGHTACPVWMLKDLK